MSVKSINFEDKKRKKSDFYKKKEINNIDDIDVNKILVSKKESNGIKNSFKHFIGYNDNDIMTGYTRKFHKNVTMSFRFNMKNF